MLACQADEVTTPSAPTEDLNRTIASSETELASRYPDVGSDVIHALVQESYTRLTPAKVHSFLPILVAREVRHRLHDLELA